MFKSYLYFPFCGSSSFLLSFCLCFFLLGWWTFSYWYTNALYLLKKQIFFFWLAFGSLINADFLKCMSSNLSMLFFFGFGALFHIYKESSIIYIFYTSMDYLVFLWIQNWYHWSIFLCCKLWKNFTFTFFQKAT